MTDARKILIVDDDVDIVQIVSTMLAGRGWEVRTAFGGEEALRVVAADHPDIVLLDIMMPHMNGLEVLRQIRAVSPASRIIMITAFGDVESYLDSMELGACEYVNKPFETAELLRVIGRVAV
jgi:two-component system OmpR family response regulator